MKRREFLAGIPALLCAAAVPAIATADANAYAAMGFRKLVEALPSAGRLVIQITVETDELVRTLESINTYARQSAEHAAFVRDFAYRPDGETFAPGLLTSVADPADRALLHIIPTQRLRDFAASLWIA